MKNIISKGFGKAIDFVRNIDYNPKHWYQGAKDLFRETSAEILVSAGIGLVAGLAGGLMYENARDNSIPLGFSEMRQIEKDALTEGRNVGPMTHYLTTLNDATMKVFECWNRANEPYSDTTRVFAIELDYATDPSLKIFRYNLTDLLDKLPGRARVALGEMKELRDARNGISTSNNSFDDAWHESHVDHYKTVRYHTTEGTGKDRKTVTKTKRVYDYTTHSYRYDSESGERASAQLSGTLKEHPDLKFREELQTTSQTHAEGEYAAEKSRRNENRDARIDSNGFLKFANTWATGSTLRANLPEIYSFWGELHEDDSAWKGIKGQARSRSYNTNSRFDSGPEPFRVAERALENGRHFVFSIDEITDGIEFVRDNAPELSRKIKEYVGVELDSRPGDSDSLSREILELAQKMYVANFKNGFDVRQFRGLLVLATTLAGGVLGGLGGLGLDKLADKKNLWDSKNRRKIRLNH